MQKQKLKKYGLLLSFAGVLLLLNGCFRLDPLLFNPSDEIEEYLFEDYPVEAPWDVGADYAIEDSMIHLMTLTSDDNGNQETIYAAYVGDPARISTDTVIVYCHGNAAHMDVYWQRVRMLAHTGGTHRFGIMLMDYRGYGLSEGTPTESGMNADVDACLNWLKGQGLSNDRCAIYGFSLGSAPATHLAANGGSLTPSWLMLEAPFASSDVMVQDGGLLSVPGVYYTDLEIDNAEEIKKVNQPFYWVHGIADDFIALESHGEVVYKNYKGNYSEAHRIPGADHGDVPYVMGIEDYLASVEAFLTR